MSVIFLGSYRGSSSPFPETVMMNYDDPGMVQFHLGGLVCKLSVSKFGMALGFYTEEFKELNDLHALNRYIHRPPSRCWDALVPGGATYNPSRSKASALPPSLRDLYAILAHTIIERRESIGIINTHDAYFLWCISSMLSMRMIEKHQGTYPPQYRLAQSTEEEAYEDIPDDICQHLHISSPIPPREPSSDEDV
ncbi:hypothetical protein GOBAR_AA17529 [Gossypium barbadense]|uniref:Uncharacterized protein n=1 Tax=Gossypium barbadense TaxID=3634 RepID=A0A2P5XIH7_GOSBA|nr:hypothetical protein GOBAR_AA17529 [Gossypium barbadense]